MNVDMKKYTVIKEMLRDHSKFYSSNVREDTLGAYAEKLSGLEVSKVFKALDDISATAGSRFPSLQDIKSRIDTAQSKSDEYQNYIDAEIKKENEQVSEVIKFVDSMIPKIDLEKYFTFYFKRFFGSDTYESILRGQSLDLRHFKRCAYVDLYKAKLKPAEAISVLQIEKEKLEKEHKQINFKPRAARINFWH